MKNITVANKPDEGLPVAAKGERCKLCGSCRFRRVLIT